MKKYTTFVENKKGDQKKISVWLDDKTAKALEESNDSQIIHFYILEKHKEDLIQLKETRRYTSLEHLFEQGHFIEDQDSDLSQHGVRIENILKMIKALSTLTDKQRNVIIARHVDNLSFNEIGRRMGVTGKTVIAHFKAAEKKIKKYYGICVKNKH
ncbi:MAG: sigma-70 family RNA polymerase sigma factor [Clostridia bacterium]|nr:sigma-70 family RNA polymerase sigma factor [Clostridia bacterium]